MAKFSKKLDNFFDFCMYFLWMLRAIIELLLS